MAEAQASQEYQTVLDTVWKDMLDYMDPDPVLINLLQQCSHIPRKMLQDLKDKSCEKMDKISNLLKLVKEYGHVAWDQLKQCLRTSGQNNIVDLLEFAEKGEDLREILSIFSTGLKEDLINYYLEYESTMPVAPLVEQHDTELTNFYVKPPMMAYKKPNAFGQEKQSDELEKTLIYSYRDLLFKNKEPYKNIYVTADAGMGKTSFSKMLTRTWCQAHRPSIPEADKFDEDDVNTMKKFDFVFLIYLRKYQSKNICKLDDMILCMIKSNLPRQSSYSKELLEKLLCNKRCLAIVEGLDEWIHPMECKTPPRKEIPHTTCYQGCSVLTTTRPWKFSTAQLSTRDVDQQVEISKLDETSSKKLETLAIHFLNDNQAGQMEENTKRKRPEDFKRTETVSFGFIRYIPYILLQMVCLWFQNSPIGKSLCELYSNIIELTLSRWLVKKESGQENCKCHTPDTDITCMKNNSQCRSYMWLLRKINKLAFYALFGKILEKTLLFDKNIVLQYLEPEEFNLCLKIGLLSEVKDTTGTEVVSACSKVMFPHKAIQEFFAAFHIASDWDENVRETIFDRCTSLSSILEMSNVFVYVCGMKPELYYSISHQFAETVSQDPRIIEYRRLFADVQSNWKTVLDYQSMQVACFKESMRNEHDQCQIVLYDVILTKSQISVDDMKAVAKIIPFNAGSLKSLNIGKMRANCEEIRQILRLTNFSSLECFYGSDKTAQLFLCSINTASSPSDLKYLSLRNMSLTDDYITYVNSLNTLQGLYLSNGIMGFQDSKCEQSEQHGLTDVKYRTQGVFETSIPCSLQRDPQIGKLLIKTVDLTYCFIHLELPHETIQSLIASIQKNILLTRLKLTIQCKDHRYGCSCAALDLQCHNKLKDLSIGDRYFSDTVSLEDFYKSDDVASFYFASLTELHINTDHLVGCSINMEAFSADVVSSFLAELNEAPALKVLCLQNIRNPPGRVVIPCLRRLEQCLLTDCDLGDSILCLSSELTSLETLVFMKTEMSKSSYREVISGISSLQQSMILKLWKIRITAVKWNEVLTCIFELPQHITVQLINITVRSDQWRQVFSCIKKLQLPVSVKLSAIRMKPEREAVVFSRTEELTVPIRVKLRGITVTNGQCAHTGNSKPIGVKLKDTTMTTDLWMKMFTSVRELPQLNTVQLSCITMTTDQWREVFNSISQLPQSVTVELRWLTMTSQQWRELLFDVIGKLPYPRHVKLSKCKGPSEEQWEGIRCELRKDLAFCVEEHSFVFCYDYDGFMVEAEFDAKGL